MKSQAAELNISKILKRHASIERESAETIKDLKAQNIELQDHVAHLLQQLEDQSIEIEAAKGRADALLSVNETIKLSAEEAMRRENDENSKLRMIISDLKDKIKTQQTDLILTNETRRQRSMSPHSQLNSPETVMEL